MCNCGFFRNGKNGGFTLVELLVVIAIIALLLSVLMPALGKAKGLGKAVVCQNNLRQMGVGQRLYLSDNRGELMWFNPEYIRVLNPYLPTNSKIDRKITGGGSVQIVSKIFICPSDVDNPKGMFWDKWGHHSYAVNHNFLYESSVYLDSARRLAKTEWGYTKESDVKRPGETYFRADMNWANVKYQGAPTATSFFWNKRPWSDWMGSLKWHGDSVNVLYFDFHTERLKTAKMIWANSSKTLVNETGWHLNHNYLSTEE
jgi:prepilin-type N-terminal cleavage/methylation domain-containing protein/prepilin-type processing-associated H-X9-DG protein